MKEKELLGSLIHDLANPLTIAMMEVEQAIVKLTKAPETAEGKMTLSSLKNIQIKLSLMAKVVESTRTQLRKSD